MGQASLGTIGNETETPDEEADEEVKSSDDGPETYDFVDYLDVDRLKFIKALAQTFDDVDEAEKFIEAERKRWNRDAVLRILTGRKEELTE